MEDFIYTPIVFFLGFTIHIVVLRSHTLVERGLLTLSFLAHVVSSFAQILLKYYYGSGGDLMMYQSIATPLADALRLDFAGIAPELVVAFFQGENYHLPVDLYGASTGTLTVIITLLLFLLGNSLYASSLLVALASYGAKILIYDCIKREFAPRQQRSILVATTLVPSAVFWSATLFKESIVVVSLGLLFLGLTWLREGRRLILAAAALACSGIVIALLKPYVLLALSAAVALYYVWDRLRARGNVLIKPAYVAIGILLGLVGFVAASRYFGKFSVERAGSSLASQRRVGYMMEGGSSYYLEEADVDRDAENRGLGEELALAPVALATALFRPMLFEARNIVQFVNAMEMTALLVLAAQVLVRNGLRGALERIRTSPILLFCAVFTFTLALGTGLASSNMGSLSRYRAPLMPFFAILLLVLRKVELPQPLSLASGDRPPPSSQCKISGTSLR